MTRQPLLSDGRSAGSASAGHPVPFRHPGRWGLMVGLGLALTGVVTAQPADAPPPAAPAPITEGPVVRRPATLDPDFTQLLAADTRYANSVDDPVWNLQAEGNRTAFLRVPVRLHPGEQPLDFDANTLRMRGGRFVAWQIPPDAPEAAQDSASPAAANPAPAPGGLHAIAPGDNTAAARPTLPTALGALATDVPRLTRLVTLDPDGNVHWSMDRFIPGAKVKDADNLYCYKIQPDLLSKKEPVRPRFEPPAPTDTLQQRAERNAANQQVMSQYQADYAVYAQLRTTVFSASPKFDGYQPGTLWAIFEINPASTREISFDGAPPMPWRVDVATWDAARALTKGGNLGSQGPGRDMLVHLHSLVQVVTGDPHPLNLRMTAVALVGAHLLPLSQPGDDVYDLCQAIINGQDSPARAAVISDLAQITPPTPASLDLLKLAARNADPTTQIIALRGLSRSGNPDPEEIKLLVETANRLITDPQGPPALDVLQQILEAARPQPGAAVPPPTPAGPGVQDLATLLTQQLTFHFTDTLRREQFIAALILKSNSEPLAAQWLSDRFLGGGDPGLTQVTLQVLASPQWAPGHGPATAANPVGGDPGATPAAVAGRMNLANGHWQLILSEPLVLNSGNHALFMLLQSPQPALQELAWKALAYCGLPATDAPPGDGATAPPPSPYLAFANAAQNTKPARPEALDFLLRQPNLPAASATLIRIAGGVDGPIGDKAVTLLLGSNRPLEAALQQGVTIDECLRFAKRVYAVQYARSAPAATTPAPTSPSVPVPPPTPPTAAGTPPAPAASVAPPEAPRVPGVPYVAGLLRDRARVSQIAAWFMNEVSAGHVPTPAQWAQTYGGESSLLPQLFTSDDELAVAVAAGLLATIDAPDKQAKTWSDQVRGQTNSSPEYAQTAWSKLKQEIYIQRLTASAGPYRLTLKVYPAGGSANLNTAVIGATDNGVPSDYVDPNSPVLLPAPAGRALVNESLGFLYLEADGKKVGFAGAPMNIAVPENIFVLRIAKPAELKNLSNPRLSDLPLERLTDPINLFPQDKGQWIARFYLLDHRMVELTMTPVPAAQAPPPPAGKPPAPAPATNPPKPAK